MLSNIADVKNEKIIAIISGNFKYSVQKSIEKMSNPIILLTNTCYL